MILPSSERWRPAEFPAEVRILCYRIATDHHMSPKYAGRERTNSIYKRICKFSVQAYICTESFNPRNILSEYGSEERGEYYHIRPTIYYLDKRTSVREIEFAQNTKNTTI